MKWLRATGSVGLKCAEYLGEVLLWAVWLCLGALLAVQIGIAASHELRVPRRLVQSFEDRLAVSGLKIKFDSASFDPSGKILVENLQVFSESFDEPLASCRSLFLQIDPWLLAVGIVRTDTIKGRGLSLYVPAMLSPTGQSEALMSEANFSVSLSEEGIDVHQFVVQIGPMAVTCSGRGLFPRGIQRETRNAPRTVSLAIKDYLRIAQEVSVWQSKLSSFEEPSLRLNLLPDAKHFAGLKAVFSARTANLSGDTFETPRFQEKLKCAGLRFETVVPLVLAPGADLPCSASVDSIGLTDGTDVQAFRAGATLRVETTPSSIDVKRLRISAGRVVSHGATVEALSLDLSPQKLPQLKISGSVLLADQPWAFRGAGDFATREADVTAEGLVSAKLLHEIALRSGHPLEESLTIGPAAPLEATVRLGLGGKFSGLTGRFDARELIVREVALKRAAARFSLVGTEFVVRDVILQQAGNRAEGSYSMDTKTLDYRFLLTGKIFPMGIAGWFHGWWERFWSRFDFPVAGPVADVDVLGRWGEPHRSVVFVYADCDHPVVRTVPFDRVRTILFIRPDFYDGLEVFASRGEGKARGRFTRSVDLDREGFRWMDFFVVSTLDLQESARVFGAEGTEIVDPFRFDRAPRLTLAGHFDGEASDIGVHHHVDLKVESSGGFRFFDFPLSDLSCEGNVEDHEIYIQQFKVGFAGGTANGRALVRGKDPNRRLSFNTRLTDGSFGQAIHTLEEFNAHRRGEKPSSSGAFQARVASGKLDLDVVAEGLYQNPYSFTGTGTARLKGAELAQINLLGALSEALKGNSALGFTSWKLDAARSSFTIEKDKLEFSEVKITGPTARLDAHGSYSLDRQSINFHAKFFPFDQGKTLLAGAIDLMLTPVSKVLELKLTGDLAKPKWIFEYGPTNFLRKLAGGEKVPVEEPPVPHLEPPPLLRR